MSIEYNKCDQEALVENWSLELKNACHISVMNTEMGQLRDMQIGMKWKIDAMFWFGSVIVIVIMGLVIKKMWGNNRSTL